MTRHFISIATLVGLVLSFGACITEEEAQKEEGAGDGKADAWDYVNDPGRFRVEFNYYLDQLPHEGHAENTPWPDDYWAYYRDSVNYRWRGHQNLSPAELYDAAFNNWTMPNGFMDLQPQTGNRNDWDAEYYQQIGPLASDVHRRRGNIDATNGRDDDGDGEIDETDDYDGIETWWGVCHAWAPAAVMEPEAQEAVTHNGQTFTASDIKALMMIAYDATPAFMLGGRCNARELDRNEEGRVTAEECRDVNAGAFHVVVTNMLGIHHRSFVEDRTTNYEVWNQPLRSYEITSLRDGLSASEAMSILGESGNTYAYNSQAVSFAEVRMRLRYITESSPSVGPRLDEIDRFTRSDYYHYILELDAGGEIIGGVWTDESQLSHPDFLWLPTNHGTNFWSISYENVHMLLEMSRNGGGGGGGGEGQVFETEPELDIPDNDSNGVSSRLTVDATGDISSLQVNVDISHTYIGDLTVKLLRNGEEVTLHARQGGSADDIVRSFSISDFDGQDVSGVWEIFVCDEAGRDVGTIHTWGLNVIIGGGGGGGGGSTLTFASTGAVSIPDNDEGGAESIINVSDSSTIRNLRVRVNIEHTWIGDLIVELRHGGLVRRLHNLSGGSEDDIESEFQVQEFNNSNIQGEWALFVSDNAGADVGQIVDWELIAEVD